MERKIDQCWTHIALRWTKKDIIDQEKEWMNVVRLRERHAQCVTITICSSCKANYCDHLSYMVYIKDHVCALCDSYIQPYLFNPINKEYFDKYIATREDMQPINVHNLEWEAKFGSYSSYKKDDE
jgi:3-methyladenine DNA glycosylase AlkD